MVWIVGLLRFLVDNAPMLVGVILPPFIHLLNTDVINPGEKFFMTMITCIAVATLLHWKDVNPSSPEQIALWIGLIFMESQVVYRLYFKNSSLPGRIDRMVGKSENTEVIPVVQSTP